MQTHTTSENGPEELLPAMTYGDLAAALERLSASETHRDMAPYIVSALRRQAPFLTGQMVMFEILRAANCLADVPMAVSDS